MVIQECLLVIHGPQCLGILAFNPLKVVLLLLDHMLHNLILNSLFYAVTYKFLLFLSIFKDLSVLQELF